MIQKIRDSVIVITGASSGIGRATALEFAQHGGTVILAARREEALQEVAQECENRGARALVVPTDVTDEEAVKKLAQQAIENFGRIDVWVNNAAVSLFGRIEEVPMEDIRQVLETNIFGCIYGARAAIPYFREQGSGVLINISSIVGKVASPFISAYTISKYGIIGLSDSLRQELEDIPDIHVCTILPGSIDTPIFQQAANYTGKAVKPIEPVYPASQVAKAIARCAEHPQREVTVGAAAKQMQMFRNIAPRTADRTMAHKVEQDHFQDRYSEQTEGNLYQPMRRTAQISGGWRPPRERGMSMMQVMGLGAAALTGSYLLWHWWRSNQHNGGSRRQRSGTRRAGPRRQPQQQRPAGRAIHG